MMPRTTSSPSGNPPHLVSTGYLIAWGALAAGLGELAARLVVRNWGASLDKSFHLNPQAVWMGAVAALLVIVPAALIANAMAQRSTRTSIRLGLPLGAVTFLATLQVLMTTSRVHLAALAMIALGAAYQAAYLASARPVLLGRMVKRSTVILALIAGIGGIGWNTWRIVVERQALARLPAADRDAPNVVLLILDTVRAASLSAYGYERPTSPTLARLATEGIRFDRALATAPWTLPSHASFFTGRYPHELDVGWDRPLSNKEPTLAERFSAAGFATGGFAANTFYASYLHGLGRGFHHYSDYPLSWSEVFGASNLNRRLLALWNRATGQYWEIGRKSAVDVNAEFLDWIDRRPSDRPFFAFLNFFDAHTPYVPPAPYRSMYLSREPPTRSTPPNLDRPPAAEVIAGLRDAYDGAITYLDAQVGELFRQLDRRGLTANTVVVVASDHGEAMGEHGFLHHGSSLFLPELQVPLIIRLPGASLRGCVVKEWVTLRDLPATLLDAARVRAPHTLPGRSLLRACTPRAEDASQSDASPLLAENEDREHLPEWYPASAGALQAIMTGDLHYIRTDRGREVLFDTRSDYEEQNDLAAQPAYAAALDSARRALRDAIREASVVQVSARRELP